MILKPQRFAVIIVVCAILLSACASSADDTSSESTSSTASESESTSTAATDPRTSDSPTTDADQEVDITEASGCVAPVDDVGLKDQDFDDSQLPWERKGADKVAIYFEAGKVSDEYRGYLEEGAIAWNKSPCIDARIVDECPSDSNCVTVSITPGDDADGNFDSVERGDFTVGGHIDLFNEELDKLGDGAKLNVTIHEMGHAVGLRHRLTERVLMNGDTYTDIFDPDEIDYYNLLVSYGNQT